MRNSIGKGGAAFALSGQRSQETTKKLIQKLIHDREEDLKVLQKEMKDINESADKAAKNSTECVHPDDQSAGEKAL